MKMKQVYAANPQTFQTAILELPKMVISYLFFYHLHMSPLGANSKHLLTCCFCGLF